MQKQERNMHSELEQAKAFANDIRFSGDVDLAARESTTQSSGGLRNYFYSNELCITEEVTPQLYKSLQVVLSRLKLPKSAVEAFVYSSPEINAQCFSSLNTECVIRFSSALVDILNKEEFEFVAGHELGHFLLSHTADKSSQEDESVEFYMTQRGQEISADRLGLVACNSLETAVKALFKTVSGLNDYHLRFDVGAFLSQLRKTSGTVGQDQRSTHPSILVRCKALIWFSLCDSFVHGSSTYPSDAMLVLDNRVKNDFAKYVDNIVQERIDQAKFDLSMWLAAHEIVQDGTFNKQNQVRFGGQFGDAILQKLIRFLNGLAANEIESSVLIKVDEAKRELRSLIPYSFETELKSIGRWNA